MYHFKTRYCVVGSAVVVSPFTPLSVRSQLPKERYSIMHLSYLYTNQDYSAQSRPWATQADRGIHVGILRCWNLRMKKLHSYKRFFASILNCMEDANVGSWRLKTALSGRND